MNALFTWLRTPVVTMALLVVGSTATLAALGQGADSVIADQQKMGGDIKTTSNTGYTTNEITTPSGTLVRE